MQNKVLATVGNKQITESDLQQFIMNLGENAAQFQSPEGKKQLLNELIMQELVYLDAIEKEADKDEEFLSGLEEMKKTLLVQYEISKMLRNISVTESEMENYFNKNKEMYKKPLSARASHILVSSEEEAIKVKEELNNGLAFADVAKKYSSCPSKEVGGDLGEFTKGRMVPEFEDAVFSMEIGDISAPVQTQFGYHIIKLISKTNPSDVALEDVKDKVKSQCMSLKHHEIYFNKQSELTAKYNVKIAE